jgi:hypothetical protein
VSFNSEVEHAWAPPETLPATILGVFAKGACVIFADEEFVAAIPATNEETNELAELMARVAFTLETKEREAYNARRDELCFPNDFKTCSKLFKQEMDKMKAYDDAKETAPNAKFLKLATAARPKGYDHNGH